MNPNNPPPLLAIGLDVLPPEYHHIAAAVMEQMMQAFGIPAPVFGGEANYASTRMAR